jgi:Dullard-like phosphatase family protein
VNGKAVAFHVKDLQQQGQTFTSIPIRPRNERPIRPPREYESDLVVVLDMDECLIHSQFLNGPGEKYAHQMRRNANGGVSNGESDTVDTFNITLPDGELVKVNERPFLRDFLQAVSQKYETHIFTAAMQVYAKPVLDTLDPDGNIFTHYWYRESCDLDSTNGAYVKNLELLPHLANRGLHKTVLVDNNPLSFLANPLNGILVSSFYNDAGDTTLPAVLELLEELDASTDVRPILDARFGLKKALADIEASSSATATGTARRPSADEIQRQQPQLVRVAVTV